MAAWKASLRKQQLAAVGASHETQSDVTLMGSLAAAGSVPEGREAQQAAALTGHCYSLSLDGCRRGREGDNRHRATGEQDETQRNAGAAETRAADGRHTRGRSLDNHLPK